MAVQTFVNLFQKRKQDYYLLRAYDLGAPAPTPSFWISKDVSYTMAPIPSFGGPYGPLSVVDNWRA